MAPSLFPSTPLLYRDISPASRRRRNQDRAFLPARTTAKCTRREPQASEAGGGLRRAAEMRGSIRARHSFAAAEL
jgi:hypothetical protein